MEIQEIKDKEVYVVVIGFHQFAEGLTGVNYFGEVFKKKEGEWSKKGDPSIKELIKSLKKDRVNVKGGTNHGYGSVGRIQHTFKAMKGIEIKENFLNKQYSYYLRAWDKVKEI